MTTWTRDVLDRIGEAEEIDIAPLRRDGTPRKPVTIWVVRVGDDLYVRSARGHDGLWFRAAQASLKGRILVGGAEHDIALVPESDPGLNDRIDVAYRTKYRHWPQYVAPMLTAEVRTTTLKLVPRASGS